MLQTGLFLQEKVSSCMKFAKISENSNRNFGKRKPLKRSNFKGFRVAEPVGFEPTCLLGKRFSRPPRYDRFDTAPYIYSVFILKHVCKKNVQEMQRLQLSKSL